MASRSMSTAGQKTLRKRSKAHRGPAASWGIDGAPGQEGRDLDLQDLSEQEDSADEEHLKIARSKTPEISYNDGESTIVTSKGAQTADERTGDYQSEAVSGAESGISQADTEGEDDETTQGSEKGKGKKKKKGKKWATFDLGGKSSSSGGYLAPTSTTGPDSDGFTTLSRHTRSGSKGSVISVGSASSQH